MSWIIASNTLAGALAAAALAVTLAGRAPHAPPATDHPVSSTGEGFSLEEGEEETALTLREGPSVARLTAHRGEGASLRLEMGDQIITLSSEAESVTLRAESGEKNRAVLFITPKHTSFSVGSPGGFFVATANTGEKPLVFWSSNDEPAPQTRTYDLGGPR